MSRTLCATAVLLIVGCAADDQPRVHRPRPARARAAVEAARAFVAAVNRLDAETAASLIDWDLWIAADARLKYLLASLRASAAKRPPTRTELASRPIEGSEATLADLLKPEDGALLVARISRERFKVVMTKDFAPEARKNDAHLASWNLDRIDRSATIHMPNGETVEMQLVLREGQWRLVPRWHPR